MGRLQFQILEITITSAEVASLFILYLFFRLVIIACSMIQFRVTCSTSIAPFATKKKIRDFLSV